MKEPAWKLWQQRTKERAIAALGGKCQECHYSGHERAFVFRHAQGTQALFPVRKPFWQSWEKTARELQKCALLCWNCDKANIDKVRPSKPSPFNKAYLVYERKSGTIYKPQGHRWLKEPKDYNSTVARKPSKKELAKLLKTTPVRQIADQFGVQSNAVHNWAQRYRIRRLVGPVR